jgi:hypothetical protein
MFKKPTKNLTVPKHAQFQSVFDTMPMEQSGVLTCTGRSYTESSPFTSSEVKFTEHFLQLH